MSWIIYAVRRRSAVREGETPTASDDVGGGRERVRERERFFVKISTNGGGRDEGRRVRRRAHRSRAPTRPRVVCGATFGESLRARVVERRLEPRRRDVFVPFSRVTLRAFASRARDLLVYIDEFALAPRNCVDERGHLRLCPRARAERVRPSKPPSRSRLRRSNPSISRELSRAQPRCVVLIR